jgi:hypothetical protein
MGLHDFSLWFVAWLADLILGFVKWVLGFHAEIISIGAVIIVGICAYFYVTRSRRAGKWTINQRMAFSLIAVAVTGALFYLAGLAQRIGDSFLGGWIDGFSSWLEWAIANDWLNVWAYCIDMVAVLAVMLIVVLICRTRRTALSCF